MHTLSQLQIKKKYPLCKSHLKRAIYPQFSPNKLVYLQQIKQIIQLCFFPDIKKLTRERPSYFIYSFTLYSINSLNIKFYK